MTTYSEFITSVVTTLSVTGVNRQYANPPTSLNTSDLPASFPEGFTVIQGPLTVKAHGGNTDFSMSFVIACEPIELSTQPTNFTLITTLADNLDSALRGAVGTIADGRVSWTITGGAPAGIIEVAGIQYWGIRCIVEGKGHGGA